MNHQPKEKDCRKTIYYDGSCRMCTAIIKKVDSSSQKEKFNPKDLTKDPLPKNISKTAAMKEIHVVDENGRVYKNAEAILKILEEYPKWKFIVRLGRLPIIKQLLPIGYKLISANRHALFSPAKGKNLNIFIAFVFVYILIVFPVALFTDELFPISRFPMYASNTASPCGYQIRLYRNNQDVALDTSKATSLFLKYSRDVIEKNGSSNIEMCQHVQEVFWPKKIPNEEFYVIKYCTNINQLPSLEFKEHVVLLCN